MRQRLREGLANDDWNAGEDSERDIAHSDPKRTARLTQLYSRLLEEVGEDPTREGLVKTPVRAAKAIQFLTQGYQESVEEVVNGAMFEETTDGMVIVRDIEFYSLCEHHLLPFYGKCHVAYLPDGKIIGLSKIPRIVDMFARRFQVQERLTSEIAHALNRVIQPLGVAVVTEAMHMCMMIRGVEKQHSSTVASCVLGAFRDDAATRKEFFDLIHTHRVMA